MLKVALQIGPWTRHRRNLGPGEGQEPQKLEDSGSQERPHYLTLVQPKSFYKKPDNTSSVLSPQLLRHFLFLQSTSYTIHRNNVHRADVRFFLISRVPSLTSSQFHCCQA